MTTEKTTEKKAMSQADKNKYIKAMILAAAGSAGIGAVIKDINSKKTRAKALDPYQSKDTIVVPIKKSKFMEDLPKPEELAMSRGESTPAISTAPVPEIPMRPQTDTQNLITMAGDAANAATSMSAEDLAARKREILRSGGRKFDFFGKRASESKKDEVEYKANEAPDSYPKDDGSGKEEGRMLFRDQQGKFVSPTDPVAVARVDKVEKPDGDGAEKDADAGDVASDMFSAMFSPVDTLKDMGRAAMDHPLWISAGTLGSVYLAAKIADSINKKRREKAKRLLDEERDRYVDLINGAEKTAENNTAGNIGALAGGAFFFPMALTALITKRIIDNRRAEKKEEKEKSDSYPDEPTILYKTSEGKDIEIGADTALMAIMVKRAMILEAERAERRSSMHKSAQVIPPVAVTEEDKRRRDNPNTGFTDEQYGNAVDWAVEQMKDKGNSKNVVDLLKILSDKNHKDEDIAKAFERIVTKPGMLWGRNRREGMPNNFGDIAKTPEFKRRLAAHEGLQDHFMDAFNSNDDYKAFKNDQISKGLAASTGLKEGGILHSILLWLAKNLGFGNMMFNKEFKNRLGQLAGPRPKVPGAPNPSDVPNADDFRLDWNDPSPEQAEELRRNYAKAWTDDMRDRPPQGMQISPYSNYRQAPFPPEKVNELPKVVKDTPVLPMPNVPAASIPMSVPGTSASGSPTATAVKPPVANMPTPAQIGANPDVDQNGKPIKGSWADFVSSDTPMPEKYREQLIDRGDIPYGDVTANQAGGDKLIDAWSAGDTDSIRKKMMADADLGDAIAGVSDTVIRK